MTNISLQLYKIAPMPEDIKGMNGIYITNFLKGEKLTMRHLITNDETICTGCKAVGASNAELAAVHKDMEEFLKE